MKNKYYYDVFISYRHVNPDQVWVQDCLLPSLEKKGIKACIDSRDFRLGAHLVLEMSRAVEQSRYTLCVLSKPYLDSNFTELEGILAEHLGLEESNNHLLLVQIEKCEPRLGLRSKLWLDMTDNLYDLDKLNRLSLTILS